MQPFKMEKGRRFNECHYYDLPIPSQMLEELENEIVEMKVTLSYFVEPNPGLSANVDPQRYQSHGFRFDHECKNETVRRFKQRVRSFRAIKSSPETCRKCVGRHALDAWRR